MFTENHYTFKNLIEPGHEYEKYTLFMALNMSHDQCIQVEEKINDIYRLTSEFSRKCAKETGKETLRVESRLQRNVEKIIFDNL